MIIKISPSGSSGMYPGKPAGPTRLYPVTSPPLSANFYPLAWPAAKGLFQTGDIIKSHYSPGYHILDSQLPGGRYRVLSNTDWRDGYRELPGLLLSGLEDFPYASQMDFRRPEETEAAVEKNVPLLRDLFTGALPIPGGAATWMREGFLENDGSIRNFEGGGFDDFPRFRISLELDGWGNRFIQISSVQPPITSTKSSFLNTGTVAVLSRSVREANRQMARLAPAEAALISGVAAALQNNSDRGAALLVAAARKKTAPPVTPDAAQSYLPALKEFEQVQGVAENVKLDGFPAGRILVIQNNHYFQALGGLRQRLQDLGDEGEKNIFSLASRLAQSPRVAYALENIIAGR